jgi:hypothetical protein
MLDEHMHGGFKPASVGSDSILAQQQHKNKTNHQKATILHWTMLTKWL